MKIFKGIPITHPDLAGYEPVTLWHRQREAAPARGEMPENRHVLFRTTFGYGGGRVRIRLSADDYFKLYINGKFVTQGPAPGFDFRYYYMEADITDYLHPGENTAAFHTYYQGLINRVWCSGDNRHMLIFDILADGCLLAASGEGVKCAFHTGYTALSTFGYDTQFAECYRAAAPEVGFEAPAFDDSGWCHAAPSRAAYTFEKQPTEPLTFETVCPAEVRRTADGLFADFGQMVVGYPDFVVTGRAGDEIRILLGQELQDDGSVRYRLRANCVYEEKMILSGGRDEFRQYDYLSFRYLFLALPPGAEADEVKCIARHYPMRVVRACGSDDPELRAVWDLCVRSLTYGVQEVIQDCMDREKGQYLADGAYSSTAHAVLTGKTAMMEKLMTNILDTARITPTLMTCAPCSYMQEIAEYVLMLPALLLAQMKLSGKADFARENYPKIAAVLDAYRTAYERDGLLYDLDKWCVVDWPQAARDGYDFDLTEGRVAVGTHSVINAYYIAAVKGLNRIAAHLGLPAYRDETPLVDRYLSVFFDADAHRFRDAPGSFHHALPSCAMALAVGLCPDAETRENIIRMITEKPPACSAFFMTFASLVGLKREGREAEIRAMLKSEGRWRNMLREGATATFEAWSKDGKWNTSLFHLCYTFAILFLCDWGMEDLFV